MLLPDALETFVQGELRLRGLSEVTKAHYRRWLTRLALHLAKETGQIPSVADISSSHLEEFLTSLLAQGLDPGTVRQAGFCFRVFFRWCQKKGLCSNNPAEELVLPKKPQRLPYCPSEEEARAFCQTSRNSPGVRQVIHPPPVKKFTHPKVCGATQVILLPSPPGKPDPTSVLQVGLELWNEAAGDPRRIGRFGRLARAGSLQACAWDGSSSPASARDESC